jgi:hypothetical protein
VSTWLRFSGFEKTRLVNTRLVNTRLWRADPHTFFLETDDHEVYALDRRDPSLQITIADAP